MEKNEAFEVLVQIVTQVKLTGAEWEVVKEALGVVAVGLDYKPVEPEEVKEESKKK